MKIDKPSLGRVAIYVDNDLVQHVAFIGHVPEVLSRRGEVGLQVFPAAGEPERVAEWLYDVEHDALQGRHTWHYPVFDIQEMEVDA